MALINPTPSDFIQHQQRALDYQQYRSTSDVLRAVSEFYKVALYRSPSDRPLNFIANGIAVGAEYGVKASGEAKIGINIGKGSCVLDNQPIIFDTDFMYEYDAPLTDTMYYVYIYYEYVEEYPANYAFVEVYKEKKSIDDTGYYLLATVQYVASNNNLIIDDSSYKNLLNGISLDCDGFLISNYISVAEDYTAAANQFLLVDTSATAITVTLPENPDDHDRVYILDVKGTFDVNPLTVKSNGANKSIDGYNYKIDGLHIDMVLNNPSEMTTLFFLNGNWKVTRVNTRDTGIYNTRMISNPKDVMTIPAEHNGFSVDNFVISDTSTLLIPEGAVFKIL